MMKALDSNPHDYSRSEQPARRLQVPAECAGLRLDAVLAQLFPELSRSRLAGWLKEGHITVDGAPAVPSRKAWGGEAIELRLPRDAVETEDRPEAIALRIVHEDDDIIVVDKPIGLVVHPGNGVSSGTLLNALLHHAPQLAALPRAGIVHRLDKDTSGLMVVAKTLEAQTDLVRQLQARTVKRHYFALVHGSVIKDGTVDAAMGRHPVQRTKMALVPGGREARTHYHVREGFPKATLLECVLDTGRTHQIRVHMASIGHPLVGDATYGRRKCGVVLLDAFAHQALHAWRLGLIHPRLRVEMHWETPLPDDFAQLLDALRDSA